MSSSKFECDCGDRFKNKAALKSHQNYCKSSSRNKPEWKIEKKKCPKCGSKVAKTQLEKHKNSKACKQGGTARSLINSENKNYRSNSANIRLDKFKKIKEDSYKCFECGKVYSKRGICSHYYKSHIDTEKDYDKFDVDVNSKEELLEKVGELYNNGNSIRELNEEYRIPKNVYYKARNKGFLSSRSISEANKVAHKKGRGFQNHSKETKEKLSKIRSKNNPGGWCKWYEYTKRNGEKTKLQGKWEVKCAEFLDREKIQWIKPSGSDYSLKYEDDNGINRRYVPDFYLIENGEYLEVKGHWWENSKQKMKLVINQNDVSIRILKAKNIEEFKEKLKKEFG